MTVSPTGKFKGKLGGIETFARVSSRKKKYETVPEYAAFSERSTPLQGAGSRTSTQESSGTSVVDHLI